MLERFRGKVKAVRVGVQPHVRLNDLSYAIVDPQIHVGHAKTFVLADLIAQELEVPLWVRFKWAPETLRDQVSVEESVATSKARVERYVQVLLMAKDQLAEMLFFLGIAVDRFYQPPTAVELPPDWSERINEIAGRVSGSVAGWTWDSRAEWYDAAVRNYPTLMVRGADWCAPLGASGTLLYVAIEDEVFEAAGHEKFVVHLPLIMSGAKKMSSSHVNAVSWRVLMPMGWDGARDFLTEGVDLERLPGESEQWDWDSWSKACQRAGSEFTPHGGGCALSAGGLLRAGVGIPGNGPTRSRYPTERTQCRRPGVPEDAESEPHWATP